MSEKDIVELLPCPFCGTRMEHEMGLVGHPIDAGCDCPLTYNAFKLEEWNARTPNMVLSEARARAEEVSAFVSRQREEPYVPSGSELNAVEDLVVAVKQLWVAPSGHRGEDVMDETDAMTLARKTAADVLGYSGEDAKGILRGDFDDKWDCLRVAKEAILRATKDRDQ